MAPVVNSIRLKLHISWVAFSVTFPLALNNWCRNSRSMDHWDSLGSTGTWKWISFCHLWQHSTHKHPKWKVKLNTNLVWTTASVVMHLTWSENQKQQVLRSDESSPEPGPQHYWSSVGSSWQKTEQKAANIQRKALGCPSSSLENYSWRLLKEMTESLSTRVQAVLKNKGAHNKYWISRSLELYKLCFCFIHRLSI